MAPTNVFFSPAVRSEQMLYEDLIIEGLKMYGQDVIYVPRKTIRSDEILNENYSRFEDAYMIEMYIANTGGFEGEGTLLSKFGIEMRDQATFIVAKRRFEQLVSIDANEIAHQRPREGDLIYQPLSKTLFEIKFVEHEQPFYRLSDLPIYELQCEMFEYSSEEFDTSFNQINQFERMDATRDVIEISGGAIGFSLGEVVYQQVSSSVTVQGEVALFEETVPADPSEGIDRLGDLTLVSISSSDGEARSFDPSYGPIYRLDGDVDSGWVVTKVYGLDDPDDQYIPDGQDSFADNTQFEIEGMDIIDFSESNPFGEL